MSATRRQITKIAREVNKFMTRTLKVEGVGPSEMDLIHVVRKNPGTTQAQIRAILGTDKGMVARQVSSLEARGYLVRKPNPQDARSQLIYPTEAAQALKRSKAQVEAMCYEWLEEALTPEEREEYARLTQIMYQRCKEESKAGFPHLTEKMEAQA